MPFKVRIDPRFRASYASFYIQGLIDLFGRQRIRITAQGFPDWESGAERVSFDHYFSFILEGDTGQVLKVVVDYRDKTNFSVPALDWCDCYGKVNLKTGSAEFQALSSPLREKIQPIGPGFGVRVWALGKSLMTAITCLTAARHFDTRPSLRQVASGFHWQIKRPRLADYAVAPGSHGYVFHASSLYASQANGESTNRLRATFVRAARQSGAVFEGGLVATKASPVPKEFRDVLAERYFPARDYMRRTERSAIVFSTPAVWGCLGWKLGEYLAMGKAIISTPIEHDLPAPLRHGEHIHIVRDEPEMLSAVRALLGNEDLRLTIAANARAYYEKHLSPERVLERLVSVSSLPALGRLQGERNAY